MQQSPPNPIFVVGSSRSGTTLVYSLLLATGQFPRYEAETLLLQEGPSRYGPLQRDRSFEAFLRDWLQSRQFARSGLDPQSFRKKACRHRSSYAAFLGFFMGEVARVQGRTRWAEKTPSHVFFVPQLIEAHPNAQFIHVVRDGRDVALSRRRLGWTGTRSRRPLTLLRYAVIQWQLAVQEGFRRARALPDRFLEIRYEDLIRDPVRTLRCLEEFAAVELDIERLAETDVGSLGRANSAFGDRPRGLTHASLERWRGELTPGEVAAVEALVGDTLALYDYPLSRTRTGSSKLAERARKAWIQGRLRAQRWLRRRTPVGRLLPTGLEIGQR